MPQQPQQPQTPAPAPAPTRFTIPIDELLAGEPVTQQAPQATAGGSGILQTVKDLLTGGVKGAVSSVQRTGLGSADAEPFRINVRKGGAPTGGPLADTSASNATQAFGKSAEQVAEFFIPANMARQAAIHGLVTLIPDSASPGMARVLNQAGAVIGRTAGEALSAYSVADLHGDPHPERAAMIAGAAPLVGSALGGAAPLLQNDMVRKILAAVGAANVAAATGASGIGAGLGAYGVGHAVLKKGMEHPNAVKALKRVAFKAPPLVGRAAAGIESEATTP